MELYLARDEGRRKLRLVFPATFSQVRDAVQDLEGLGGSFGRVHIKDAEGAAKQLVPYIRYTELEWTNGVDKLNELARRFDGMDADTQKLFFGALEMRIANNIYDVLEVLSELDQYELISEAVTDRELGEWVVAQGKLGIELPAEALPLLDYPRIGAEYKASHGGTYTTSGYMKRREMVPAQAVDVPKTVNSKGGSNMSDKFFPELARRLRQEGIETGQPAKSGLPVLVGGQEAMWVDPRGSIILKSGALDDAETDRVYETAVRASAQVYEYTEAMASAPKLEAVGLGEDFRLLAEFNGVVLAGQELERGWGYKFVTWRRDGDGTGVAHGNYYHNDYAGATLDFACRSGLVQEHRQFTNAQLTELYCCIHETLDSGYPTTDERRKTLAEAAAQIEHAVDDLEERVEQSNRRELEAAEGRGPRWEMTP